MRTLRKNKQKMYYAIPLDSEEDFARDSNGDPLIDCVDDDGTIYYQYTGEPVSIYSEPTEFSANIDGEIRETMAQEFGITSNPNYAKLVTAKGAFNFPINTIIWRGSRPEYRPFKDGIIVDSASADYDLVGIIDEALHEDEYLLHKRRK